MLVFLEKVLSRSPSKSQEFIQKRQKAINESYAELIDLSKVSWTFLCHKLFEIVFMIIF